MILNHVRGGGREKGPFFKESDKSLWTFYLGNITYKGSTNFFCKGLDTKYFWLYMLHMVSVAYSLFSVFFLNNPLKM